MSGAYNRQIEVCEFGHLRPTEQQIVVTSADPERRVVWSLHAEPAAEECARLIGSTMEDLTPEVFAANPLLVRIGGEYHVRAIQQVDREGALHFYCAVDEGIVLTLAHPEDMRDNLVQNMERISERIGALDTVLCFDCILRRLEAERLGIKDDLLPIFSRYNMIGFNTYGEQYRFLHLSQRSEEHTSELQSLMRISYAVFCLKKKTINKKLITHYSKKQTEIRTMLSKQKNTHQ